METVFPANLLLEASVADDKITLTAADGSSATIVDTIRSCGNVVHIVDATLLPSGAEMVDPGTNPEVETSPEDEEEADGTGMYLLEVGTV